MHRSFLNRPTKHKIKINMKNGVWEFSVCGLDLFLLITSFRKVSLWLFPLCLKNIHTSASRDELFLLTAYYSLNYSCKRTFSWLFFLFFKKKKHYFKIQISRWNSRRWSGSLDAAAQQQARCMFPLSIQRGRRGKEKGWRGQQGGGRKGGAIWHHGAPS